MKAAHTRGWSLEWGEGAMAVGTMEPEAERLAVGITLSQGPDMTTTTRLATALAIGGALIGSGCAKKSSATLESH